MGSNTTARVVTLNEHRQLLKRVFQTAKQRVLIVSPFISSSALAADNVYDLVREAAARGVVTTIYTDYALNKDGDRFFKRTAAEGIASLHAAGASVSLVKGIHNKTLAMDKELIAEGSFNWLSAVRTTGADHQREERTLVVEGTDAAAMIEREITSLEKREVVATATEVVSALGTADSGKPTTPAEKPDYLTLWLPFGLFVLGLATCTVSMICILFFGFGVWALLYRFKQFADYEYNKPDDNPGRPAYRTEEGATSDFVDIYSTIDIRSTSMDGGANYGSSDRMSQDMDDQFRNMMNSD